MPARFNVFRKLLAAFMVVAIAGALGGAFGLFCLGKLSGDVRHMYDEQTEPLAMVFSLYGTTLSIQPIARDLGDLRDVVNNSGRVDRYSVKIDETLSSLLKTAGEGPFRNALESYAKNWADYKADLAKLAEAAKGRDPMAASDAYATLLTGAASGLESAHAQMVASFTGQGVALSNSTQAFAKRSMLLIGLSCALSLLASMALAFAMGKTFASPLRAAGSAAKRIASGELALAMDGRLLSRGDEFGDLARALAVMAEELRRQMSTIHGSVEELAAVGASLQEEMRAAGRAIAEVSDAAGSVGADVVNQSAGVEETAATVRSMTSTIESLDREIERQTQDISTSSASIEQMVGNIAAVGESISRLETSFNELSGASDAGRLKLEGVTAVIMEIANQSEKLSEANSVVSGIAARTNLLAMNAAIEAAHAGDSGRGFAVVADEIRGLAESASRQSKEISRDIGGIRSSIDGAVTSSEAARRAFATVVELVGSVSALEREINASLAEQREGSRLALEGLASIKEVTARVHSGSQELGEGSKAIGTEMGELERMSIALKEAASGIARSVAAIEKATGSVSTLSERNGQAISAVEELLARYALSAEGAGPEGQA